MKTSNIIITAFAILIVSGTLFLFADAKKHKEEEKNKISYKELPLSAFKVIVAEYHSVIHVDRSDSTLIKIEYVKGVKVPAKLYEVINDTLHVYSGLRAFVKCKNIKTVIGNNHFWLGVNKFSPDSITFRVRGGKTYFDNGGIEEKPFNIGVIALDSAVFNISNVNANRIFVNSDNAIIDLHCKIHSITAQIKNGSKLNGLSASQNIRVNRDSTSSFNSY
jgi:hypothetical protein